jgi:hypothetical protein
MHVVVENFPIKPLGINTGVVVYKSAAYELILSALLLLGTASVLLTSCGQATDSAATATQSPIMGPAMSPLPGVAGYRVIPAPYISNSAIDAHIPRNTDVADRKIVRAVMKVLVPSRRQYVLWMHVPPGKYGYEMLPDHGLMVMYCGQCAMVAYRSATDFYGNYVLYYSGKVQPDSSANYGGPGLNKYLISVPDRFDISSKYP